MMISWGTRADYRSKSWLLPLMLFAVLSAGIGVVVVLHLREHTAQMEGDVRAELQAIAMLKVDQIGGWYRERLADAKVILENPVIARRVDELFRGLSGMPTSVPSRILIHEMREWMESRRRNYDYEAILLFDPAMNIRLAVASDVGSATTPIDTLLLLAAERRDIVSSDLYLVEGTERIRLDFVAPLLLARSLRDTVVVGFVVLRVDPERFLFPLIQTWPTPSRTAETLLIRREGSDVVYLNELRHRQDTALRFRLPVSEQRLPAAMAARGEEGIVEGFDYRRAEVFAAVKHITGTPWFMVAKIDSEEVFAPIQSQTRQSLIMLGTLILFVGAGTGLYWRWHQAHHYRQLYELEKSKRLLTEHYDFIAKYANDIILLTDEHLRIVEINQRAIEQYGYARGELIGEHVSKLRAPDELQGLRDLVRIVEAQNGLVYETRHRRKDGSVFPVEASARMITIEGQKYYQAIIRDITERKETEARMAKVNRLYRVLSEINQLIVREPDRNKLLDESCRILVTVGGFKLAWVGELDPLSRTVKAVSVCGEGREYLSDVRISIEDVPEGRGPTGRAIREGRMVVCSDFESDERMAPWREKARRYGIRSSIALPLWVEGATIGALNIYSSVPDFFDDEEVRMLTELADDISFALQHIEQVHARQRVVEELRKSEEWLSALFEASRDGIVVEQNETIVFANRSFATLYGYDDPTELLGRHISVVQSPEDSPRMLEYGRKRLRGEKVPSIYEFKGVRKDGTSIELEVSVSTFVIGACPSIISVVRDISDRKKAEQALREAEQKLRAVVEHSTNLFYTHTTDHRLTYVSPQTRQFFDCEPEEALVRWTEFLTDHPVNQEGVRLTERAIETGQIQPPYELELRGKRGRTIWVEVREAPLVRDGKTVAIVGSLTDITERKRAEEELRRSESQFRLVWEKSTDGMRLADEHGTIISVNDAFCQLVGMKKNDLEGRPMSVTYIQRPGDDIMGKYRATFASRQPIPRQEAEVFLWNGERKWLEISSSFFERKDGKVLLLSIFRDISERKRAEEALRQSEERFRRLTENAQDLIYRYRFLPSRGFEYVSPAATVITGYTPEEHYADPDLGFKIVHPDDRPLLQEVSQGEKLDQPLVLRWVRKDGSIIWTEQRNAPIFDEQGNLVAIEGIARDITERIQAEEERKRMQAHIAQAQRLESLGTLAGGIAHDFNNILAIILAHASALENPAIDDRQKSKSLAAINGAVNRGAALVRQILTFARRTEVKPQAVDVNRIIKDLVHMLEETFPKTILVQLDLEQNLPTVFMDPNQLNQALLNLCVNARDAMKGAGVLSLSTRCVEKTNLSHRQLPVSSDRFVAVTISDTGIGMNAETMSHLFEPFFTTKEEGKGTGLGLAVVYGIVEAHGGVIEVSSEPGRGTTFTMFLPADASEPSLYQAEEVTTSDTRQGTETVLIVEDEDHLAELLILTLQSAGYNVLRASDGIEALAQFASHTGKIHLVLTDIGLPRLSGVAMLSKLKQIDQGVRVLVMSGFLDPEMKAKLVNAGALDFIQKPFKPNDILRRVRNSLDAQ